MLKYKNQLLAVLLSALLVALSGCSDADKDIKAWNEFGERCNGKIKATLSKGAWNSYFVLECDDFNPTTKAN